MLHKPKHMAHPSRLYDLLIFTMASQTCHIKRETWGTMVKADSECRGTPTQKPFQVSVCSDTKDGLPTSNAACGLGALQETSNGYDETPFRVRIYTPDRRTCFSKIWLCCFYGKAKEIAKFGQISGFSWSQSRNITTIRNMLFLSLKVLYLSSKQYVRATVKATLMTHTVVPAYNAIKNIYKLS